MEGHLRETGGDEASHDLRDDRDYAQDDRERDQSHVGGDGREVHLNPEGDEENGRENGPQSSRSLGEVVLERLVREQGSREEGADNRGEAYGLRGGSEQERDRQRDEEPTVPETQLLSLDLNSNDNPPEQVDADRQSNDEKSNRLGKQDREIGGAHPSRRRADGDGQDNQAEDVIDDRGAQDRPGHPIFQEVEFEEHRRRDRNARRGEGCADEQGHGKGAPVRPARCRGHEVDRSRIADEEGQHDASARHGHIPRGVNRPKVTFQADEEEEEDGTEDRQSGDDRLIEHVPVGAECGIP